MSTQKLSQFGAERFIQELLKSKEAKPLDDFDKAFFKACDVLRKKDYEIIYQRYFGDEHKLVTQQCIGEAFNLCQSRVCSIIQRCFRLLRKEPTIFLFTEGHDYIQKRAVPYLERIQNGENPEVVYNIPIKDIGFNDRIFYRLKNNGIATLYELSKTTLNDLFHIRNFGRKSVEYIDDVCICYGITLKTTNKGGINMDYTIENRIDRRIDSKHEKLNHARNIEDIYYGATKFLIDLTGQDSESIHILDNFKDAWLKKSLFLSARENEMLDIRYFAYDDRLATYEEIAFVYNVSHTTVHKELHKSLRLLRQPSSIKMFTEENNTTIIPLSQICKQKISNGEDPNNVYDINIRDLNLSVRAENGLLRHGINTLYQLSQTPIDDLTSIRNFGRTSLNEVLDILHEFNIE